MSKHCLVSFGEALIDLIVNESINCQGFVGGAPANVAAAVSKLGGKSYFIGSIGQDIFGNKIVKELSKAGIDTKYFHQLNGLPTAAAYVELDSQGERKFSFSRHETADLQFPVDQIPIDLFAEQKGVFHFGSNTLTTDYMTAVTLGLVSIAKQYGWTVSYDVNLRANLWPKTRINIERVMAFLNMSDIVKMSIEEVNDLGLESAGFKQQDDKVFVITSGSGPIELYAKNDMISHTPEAVKAIDTTGAGDSFFGAFLYAVCQDSLFDCQPKEYLKAVEFAAKCGAYSVQSKGAISSYPNIGQVPY